MDIGEPQLIVLAAILVWPLVGWLTAAARGLRRPRAAVPFMWTAAAAAVVGAALLTVASTGDPTTPTEGMRDLGIGLLGAANLVGALISAAIAAGLRWSDRDPTTEPHRDASGSQD